MPRSFSDSRFRRTQTNTHEVLGSGFLVLGSWFWVLGSRFWVLGSGFTVRPACGDCWRGTCTAPCMAGARRPEELDVWKLAWELKQRVYAFTETGPASRDFKFREEIRDAARSAPDNISEGFYRFAPRQFNHFMDIAKG